MFLMMTMSVFLIGGLAVLAYTLAIYALPFAITLWVGRLTFITGAGWIGAGVVGLLAGVVSYYVLAVLFATLRPPILRIGIAVIFTVPAAIAGYALVHGIMAEAVPSPIWLEIFSVIGGGATGVSALARLAAPPLDSN
jgi:hypothetical protein